MDPPSPSGAGAVFDLPRALENALGDLETLIELAGIFCDSADASLARVAEAVARRDGEALRQSAHRLKGSVSPFCAEAAHRAALSMENLGKANDFAEVDRAWRDLEREMGRLRQALRELLIGADG